MRKWTIAAGVGAVAMLPLTELHNPAPAKAGAKAPAKKQ